jgi:hypothetical protein
MANVNSSSATRDDSITAGIDDSLVTSGKKGWTFSRLKIDLNILLVAGGVSVKA